MEAESYLSSGYGLRLALEAKLSVHERLGALANVWQPSRLKGITVGEEYGTPFLAATQVFDQRPVPRKFLSLDRTDSSANRFVTAGTIMLTCSGSVGRATLATDAIKGILISHDLLRIEATEPKYRGWVYAFLRSPTARAMMTSAQYGHIIKHLEPSHLYALPVPSPDDNLAEQFECMTARILEERNQAYTKFLEAERLFEKYIGQPDFNKRDEVGFSVSSSSLAFGRRRLEGVYHNPSVQALYAHFKKANLTTESLKSIGAQCWLPGRFQRIPAEEGIELVGSANLFEVNPDLPKRIADINFGDEAQGRVKEGWLLLARSGQTYGLNGTLAIANKFLEEKIISDHVIRIKPRENFSSRVGYIYTALSHPTLGRPLVKSLAYGSSIPEIEVEDVNNLQVVRLTEEQEAAIADLAESAAKLYADADILENEMTTLMEQHLQKILGK
ncbi:hypothetical protein ACM74M_12085 [Pseudomonas aeruginosa]|uniref:hypothetical protein n=1 Tax=Pseudomonadaceae TaxID=135621 RepID=UPI000F51B036|nr:MULTISPECIES: hypothetical protein [Pseudomonadaceae]EJN1406783.1 hypothetical protein [Pseudomonas aeruginosa]EJV1461238.1 hypothetical protein [Pseudomonas aeruginosa]EKU3712540.1 hypothetical protein [Pseudomonas aeruginosa]EKU8505782.1 hypothetical protein [Pseudomonas aeruginosa]EKU9097377.1 hypothetical protein [Pseudomonas aeruginosa]